jgi:hypothetical protein
MGVGGIILVGVEAAGKERVHVHPGLGRVSERS